MLKEVKKLTDRDVYEHYKKKRKKVAKSIKEYRLFAKTVNAFLDEIYKQTIESEDGVYIEGLGYFFNRLTNLAKPRATYYAKGKPLIRTITGKYRPTFIADAKLSVWHYDRYHSAFLMAKLRGLTRKGKKYKIQYSQLDNFKK